MGIQTPASEPASQMSLPPSRRRLSRRVPASLLALTLLLALAQGMGLAQAASPGKLAIRAANDPNVIGGPPGVDVAVTGSFWPRSTQVMLSVGLVGTGCGSVFIDSFVTGSPETDSSGTLTALFQWPLQANQLGAYTVCGALADGSFALSSNTFQVLASSPLSLTFSPSSLAAGDAVTVVGSSWVPGPQSLTVQVSTIPACHGTCLVVTLAEMKVVTAPDGTFRQHLTIPEDTPPAMYSVVASNGDNLSEVAPGSMKVTGPASSSGTPSIGSHPTTTATPGQARSSFQHAWLVAGFGLVVLFALIGALVFWRIKRARGAPGGSG